MGVRWHGQRVEKIAREAGMAALEAEAQRIFEVSQNIVPLNKDPKMAWHRGTLQRSGNVTRDDDGNSVTIRYSVAEDYDYAAEQHDTWYYHHEPGLKAFYLEEPMRMLGPDAVTRTGAAIKAALRSTP